MNTSKHEVTDAELAEVLPLVGLLVKTVSHSRHQVPADLKATWMKHALAPRHMNTLLSLALSGPASVSELSSRLGTGLATASLIVGELSRVGLVVRTEDETDRRRTLVDVAPAHRQAIRKFLTHKTGIVRHALGQLEPRERAALAKGLRALIGALDASAFERAAHRPLVAPGLPGPS